MCLSSEFSGQKAELSGCLFPLEGCLLGHSVVVAVVDDWGVGGVLLKLTHIRPWVLPDPGGGGVGWICRSFHGQLIFKMGLWSGQREVSEKYWPVRRRSGNGYPPLPVVSSGYEGYALLGNQKHD